MQVATTMQLAYDALLDLLTAAFADTDTFVYDAIEKPGENTGETIGLLDVDAGTQDWSTLGGMRRVERFDINGQIRVWAGDSDVRSLRARAVELFGVVGTLLEDHPTLGLDLQGGVAGLSRMGLQQGIATDTKPQRMALLPFSVTVTAELER